MANEKKKERGIKPEYYFDEELTSFALHLEADSTMEVEEIADFFEKFAQGLRTGDVPMFDPNDEVILH